MRDKLPRLTKPSCVPDRESLKLDVYETTHVLHIYLDDAWPGPSAFLFINDQFANWDPYVSYERAVRLSTPA